MVAPIVLTPDFVNFEFAFQLHYARVGGGLWKATAK